MPRSRTNPQFNGESFPDTLAPWQIGYEHIAALGGLRGKPRSTAASPNGYWRVRSFRNYADYALTDLFSAGLARLRELGTARRCAIMCAEAVWWRCHRRIITDYLISYGDSVMHILGPSQVNYASMTPGLSWWGREGSFIPPKTRLRNNATAPASVFVRSPHCLPQLAQPCDRLGQKHAGPSGRA